MSETTDLATREIVYGAIRATTDEMERLIGRTAMSEGFRDKKDYFVGLFDTRGRMIFALAGLTGAGLVDPILDHFELDEVAPGDIFFFNDPYTTRGAVQHLGDVVVSVPIFCQGELLGFAAGYGHVADLGGLREGGGAGKATEIFHEGIAYPPMRVGRDHEIDPSFLRLLERNSRRPDLVRGDWRALLAACRLGAARVDALAERYGRRTLLETIDWALAHTAARVRQILDEQIPDGTYETVTSADVPGLGLTGLQVSASLHRRGNELLLDLTGTSPDVPVPINYLATLSGVQLLLARVLLVFDENLEMNQGILDTLTDLRLTSGTLVSPEFPRPLNNRSLVKSIVLNCLSTLVAQANGGHMTANFPTYIVCNFQFPSGVSYSESLGVGFGGRPFGDGPDVIYGMAQRNYPVEFVEPTYPVRIRSYRINDGSGGPGRFRGGCGAVREIEVLQEATLNPSMSHTDAGPDGQRGGGAGRPGSIVVEGRDGERRRVPGVSVGTKLQPGDVVVLSSAGGGGWGDPKERDREAVLRDVREGFVSAEDAERDYGVTVGSR
ncbi:hydantoinase B/oxoprolinase family protein [Microtetraspora fusca]|uniref:Hydantoinase B/oxoprolinase family protein n=1 Tax=Microtetraspora fusca TaxID=1997 RepID=A0ABW6VN79_MICFU|nr:hydantoinase B/oxoprolinase family protein [Microtetraspora fusca]